MPWHRRHVKVMLQRFPDSSSNQLNTNHHDIRSGGGILRPYSCPFCIARTVEVLSQSMFLTDGYVHVWTFAGAISSPTFV